MTRLRRYEKPDRPDIIPPRYRRRLGGALLAIGAPLLIVGEETYLWEYGMTFFGLLGCMFGLGFLFADTREGGEDE